MWNGARIGAEGSRAEPMGANSDAPKILILIGWCCETVSATAHKGACGTRPGNPSASETTSVDRIRRIPRRASSDRQAFACSELVVVIIPLTSGSLSGTLASRRHRVGSLPRSAILRPLARADACNSVVPASVTARGGWRGWPVKRQVRQRDPSRRCRRARRRRGCPRASRHRLR
jgi:hypothetical protein